MPDVSVVTISGNPGNVDSERPVRYFHPPAPATSGRNFGARDAVCFFRRESQNAGIGTSGQAAAYFLIMAAGMCTTVFLWPRNLEEDQEWDLRLTQFM